MNITITSVPWEAITTRTFHLTNLKDIAKSDILFVSRGLIEGKGGFIVYCLTHLKYDFWFKSCDNIENYLDLKRKRESWADDLETLQRNNRDLKLTIG